MSNYQTRLPRFRRGTSHHPFTTQRDPDRPSAYIQAGIQGNRNKALSNQSKVLFHMGPGYYTKGVTHMADLTGLTVDQVRLAFARLEKSGQIVLVSREFGMPKVYRRTSSVCNDW